MANYFIIGGDGKEYGPITGADVRLWIAEGRLNAQSAARREADASWQTLGALAEFADAFSSTPPTIAPPVGSANDANWEAAVLARTPELKLGECLSAGWNFLGTNAGFLISAVLLTWVTNLIFVFGAEYVPLVGSLALLYFNGVIMGGFYFACVRRLRGEPVAATEALGGFKNSFGQLALAGLVSGLLTGLGMCFCILPMIYLMIAWSFALPLVADKKMQFWAAMELSRTAVTKIWFEVFALLLLAFLPTVLFQLFSAYQSGQLVFNFYEEAGRDWKQLFQLMQSHDAEIKSLAFKSTLIGQVILLVNLLFATGVVVRAYENLFGQRKP